MAAQATEPRLTPPYLPFKTFIGFLDALKETAVPQRIDPSVMGKYSGTMKTQLRTALRFFSYIDDNGIVDPSLRKLVSLRGTSDWKNAFSGELFSAYSDIVGDLDLDRGTLQQLKEQFKKSGVEGSVLIKGVRFYLAALEESGAKYSPHFKVRGLSVGVGNGRTKTKVKGNGKPTANTSAKGIVADLLVGKSEQPEVGTKRFALPIKDRPEAVLVLPEDMSGNEWKMIDGYIRMYFGLPSE